MSENLSRLKSKLRRHPAAMRSLNVLGLVAGSIERLHLGLKEPYRSRTDGVEVSDALCYPVLDGFMRPTSRYAYLNIPGVTLNPCRSTSWGPGRSLPYALGSTADGATALVAAEVLDCWRAWQASCGQQPGVAFLARSHGEDWPAEWKDGNYWKRYGRIAVLPGEGQIDLLRELALRTGRPVRRLRLPSGVPGIWDIQAADFADWIETADVWLPDAPASASAIDPTSLGLFEASAVSIVGAFNAGFSYYPFAVERRETGTEPVKVLQSYATMVLRSDGHLLECERLAAPGGTATGQRIMALSDGTRISDEPLLAMNSTWSFSSIHRFSQWRLKDGARPHRDLRELIADIEGFLRDQVWLPVDEQYLLAALYVALSHVYRVFDAIPLLLILGPSGTGKSELGEAIARVSANAVVAGQLRAAGMIRLIGETRGLLVLDDMDGGGASSLRGSGELAQAIKTSYKRSTACKPIADRGGRVRMIDFFGPKVVSNTCGVDAALGSRMIVIRSQQLDGDAARTAARWWMDSDLDALRDELHCWGMASGETLWSRYRGVAMDDRRSEILAPLRTLMALIDDETVHLRFAAATADPRSFS